MVSFQPIVCYLGTKHRSLTFYALAETFLKKNRNNILGIIQIFDILFSFLCAFNNNNFVLQSFITPVSLPTPGWPSLVLMCLYDFIHECEHDTSGNDRISDVSNHFSEELSFYFERKNDHAKR